WRKLGKKGLTIPFIIGSQRFLPAKYPHQAITELIEDMVLDGEFCLYVTYCQDINSIILGIKDEKKLLGGDYPHFKGYSQKSFYITSIIRSRLIEDLINELIDRYQHMIDNNKFSFNEYRTASDFSQEDIEFIKNSFSEHKVF
ncbi:MAG: hypothetical protein ACOCWM_04430, partial [Cyclobacteriaceae bacterium]